MHFVTLHNFQSHKDTVLELSPTVNSLEGVSDSGKSAVLRAMLWCLTNKPDGVAFASNWAKDKKGKLKDEVSVSIDNITRTRTADVNGYTRYTPGGLQSYEALKGTIPPDIENAINIGSVNIQRQMDPPFLLSATPGDAARYVNELIGLVEIDSYQKALKGKAHDTANSLKDGAKRLAEVEASLAQYDWVDGAKEKVDALAKIVSECTALESDLQALAALDEVAAISEKMAAESLRCDKVSKLIDAVPDTAKLESEVELLKQAEEVPTLDKQLESDKAIVEAAEEKIQALSKIAAESIDLTADLDVLDSSLRADKATCDKLFPAINLLPNLERLIQDGLAVADEISALEGDVAAIIELENLTTALEGAQNSLHSAEHFLHGKACPICGKPL